MNALRQFGAVMRHTSDRLEDVGDVSTAIVLDAIAGLAAAIATELELVHGLPLGPGRVTDSDREAVEPQGRRDDQAHDEPAGGESLVPGVERIPRDDEGAGLRDATEVQDDSEHESIHTNDPALPAGLWYACSSPPKALGQTLATAFGTCADAEAFCRTLAYPSWVVDEAGHRVSAWNGTRAIVDGGA